jgi:large subunit ribosomal protein L4
MMPQLAVRNQEGEKVGQVEVRDEVLGLPLNHDLVHQALRVVENRRHVGRHKVLTRGEISLTTAKWYRQKGLGRARHGSRSANLFVGGHKAHGPTGLRRELHVPRKMRRKALLSVLSEQVRDGVVTILDGFHLTEISTSAVARILKNLGCRGRTLLLLSPDEFRDETLYLSCRNLPNVFRREVPHLSVCDVLCVEHILITQSALQALEALAGEEGR